MGLGTFAHLKSPPLDPHNSTGQSLWNNGGKGFTSRNCFIFYSFPRRCNFKPTVICPSPRDKWPVLREPHDNLHSYWRSRGGKVVLIMGENAERAYDDMVRRDNVLRIAVLKIEAFDMWVERSKVFFLLELKYNSHV